MESNDQLEQLLKRMYAEEEETDTSDIIDEEWKKFEAKYFGQATQPARRGSHPLLKAAAAFIGVVMLSGIAFAAIRYVKSRAQETVPSQIVTKNDSTTISSIPITGMEEQPDSAAIRTVVFENSELVSILDEMSAFYKCDVKYENERAKHVRLYFTWDQEMPLEEVVRTFNKFERFHISLTTSLPTSDDKPKGTLTVR